jgi:hypothetical protein
MYLKQYALMILSCITLFILEGCTNKDFEGIAHIPTEYQKIDFSLDSIASDLFVIPLSASIPIPYSYFVESEDSCLYYRHPPSGKIFKFNFNGKLINILDKNGRGPEEYLGLGDFYVDTTLNIHISNNYNGILVYDRNYTYLSKTMYPDKVNGRIEVRWLDNRIHLFYFNLTDTGNSWFLLDSDGTVLDSRLSIDKYELPIRTNDIQIFQNHKKLYRYYNKNDTIYEIDNYGIRPFRVINREYKDGFDLLKKNTLDKPPLLISEPHRVIRNIFGIGDCWIIKISKFYRANGYTEQETILYSLKENLSYLINSDIVKEGTMTNRGILNDWIGYGSFNPRSAMEVHGDKYLIWTMTAIEFISYVQSEGFVNSIPKRPCLKQKMISIGDTLNIDDNPILMLLKLK